MTKPRPIAVAAGLILATSLGPLSAEADPASAVRAALEAWRDDFNARRAGHICDLFAPDLRYDFQGLPEQDHARLCARLNRALADGSRSFHYDLRIKEIIASGDLAVVRLTWTSTLTGADGKQVVETEPGMDLFGRQPDGTWRIIRYIAYPDR